MAAIGLILFGHGARDARWAEPMEQVKERVMTAMPDARIALAFLEVMEPDLATAAQRLVAAGCRRLVIVPVFVGQGGHVRRDLAALVDALRVAHPTVDVTCAAAVGEDDTVLNALAQYCVKNLQSR